MAESVTNGLSAQDLQPGVWIAGIRPAPVTVIATPPAGPGAVNLIFRDTEGHFGERLLYAADLDKLSLHTPDAQWTFDADGTEFRLAAEALRIRMAGLHDPMLAISASNVQPLPHQIRAVYGELLPRTPLRFLLADDPGAGKTIMAGLYAKELILRGDLQRMLIIAPGGLVEQWQDELASKFEIDTELLTRDMATAASDGNPFTRHPMLIARMDQLSRSDELLAHLTTSEWDLIVVDEAHRMSANWWSGELRKTRRYELGQQLGSIARHLLLMTATPHSGSEENYQAFLALLDPDRFEGQYREGVHSTDTTGLMRRMVKEELLTFEGKPLFPERIAETVPYALSDGERELYEAVTHYVRSEMNRADALSDSPRKRTVGFALTVLQRRLASSPHAILRSLERRRDRLQVKRAEMLDPTRYTVGTDRSEYVVTERGIEDFDSDELDAEEAEQLEESVVDLATAARTAAELQIEIDQLAELVTLARQVRDSRKDRKWEQLRSLLLDRNLLRDEQGNPRKLIIFTEHRDTLEYLVDQIRNQIGRDDAVLTIHGGTSRENRRKVREEFTHDPQRQVLVATDAAGEGLNLQAAHLMINYDLPWNPNRLEQRFGRIHRIGQQNVCRLWNLVAEDTREGQVFTRLLSKMEQQRKAYGGRLFDVLGEAFTERSLRDLLIQAIRYGDDPAKRAELDQVIDAEVANGLEELLHERALAREALDPVEVERLRRQMDEARARKLQPHYISAFFRGAFGRIGGRMSAREADRFQITNVPAALRNRQHPGAPKPIATSYERVTFEPSRIDVGSHTAEFLAPGHPLLDMVLDSTLERHRDALTRGAVLMDPTDSGTTPRLVVALTSEIVDALDTTVSKRFAFVTLTPDGAALAAGPAPYLDAEPLPPDTQDIVEEVLAQPWLAAGVEQLATEWAVQHEQPEHLAAIRARIEAQVDKTISEVRRRLSMQINYLDGEAARLRDEVAAGKHIRRSAMRQGPDRLEARARDLERRLESRLTRLAAEGQLAAKQPTIAGAALLLPAGLLGQQQPTTFAVDTTIVERRAVDAVLAAERALGRKPEEMPHNNPGYDVRSIDPNGQTIFIEVKGRIKGAQDFHITKTEVLTGKNTASHHRLAMVTVHPDGAQADQVRYVLDAFVGTEMTFEQTYIGLSWKPMWDKGSAPL
ncbi:helicase-related protein [Rhodococcus koreensis]|uniref:helicase-related protein n=1 Tax=Rhodococcus koreensis TaxID=99653 RepID=UPI0036730317